MLFCRPLAILFLVITPKLWAFAAPTELSEQLKQADAVLRIVVVSLVNLDENTEDSEATSLAKCRIIAKYKGGAELRGFIFIPCDWYLDPDPSPLEMKGDYFVCLNLLQGASFGHPLTWDATHEVRQGKVELSRESGVKTFTAEDFAAHIRGILAQQALSKQQGDVE